MINWKSILSSFNDKPTLLEWLKLVEKALKESVLTSVTTEQDADKSNTKLIFNFEDGTQIETGFFPTKGKDAAEIISATSMYIGTTSGLSKSRVTFGKSDNRSFYTDILVKAGKAIESFTSAVKEVTDENTVNTITVNYDDKTNNTFEVSSARGKQGAAGATGATGAIGPAGPTGPKGADGVSITGIDTVSDEVVGDETLTTLRAHYSNSTTDEFVVTAKNGKDGSGGGKLYAHSFGGDSYNSSDTSQYIVVFYSTNGEKITYDNVNSKKIPFAFVYKLDSNGNESFVNIAVGIVNDGPPNTISVKFAGAEVGLYLTNISSAVTEV